MTLRATPYLCEEIRHRYREAGEHIGQREGGIRGERQSRLVRAVFDGGIGVRVEDERHHHAGRKGIDGLAGVVRAVLGHDPAYGDVFVFKNRRGDKIKILAWMGDGFAQYLRRLEKETVAFPTAATPELAITTTQMAMILGGVEWARTRTRTRFQQSV